MTVDRSLQGFFEDASQARASARDEIPRHLQSGDGGGTSGGMEARLARLEADIDHVKRGVAEIKGDIRGIVAGQDGLRTSVAVIDEKLRHVATVPQLWTAAIGIVAALGGIVALMVRFLPHAG